MPPRGMRMATSGPGATNLVTPIADAHMDSVPMVAVTGQVPAAAIGTDAFQEADIRGITMPITKHNFLVNDPNEIASTIAEAFYIASTGRPGPVLVDAEKPVLYVGGGVIRAKAHAELKELAEKLGIPVVTTLMARGALPDTHELHFGMPGMHGSVSAVGALQRSDLLICLGARFDDRVTGKLSSFAPEAKVIHADIDPAEIGKNRHADVPIVGDVKAVITDLIEALRKDGTIGSIKIDNWWEYLRGVQSTYPLSYGPQSDGSLSPEYVIEMLGKIAGSDAVYVAGVGQHQMWAAQFIKYENPRTWLNSGGLGTMGFAVPAAMGAKFGRPEAEVWAIDGDGCFQMTNQELATCAIEGLPIKVAVINNGNLGMVRQWQNLFYEGRYSQTDLGTHKHRIPDFKLLGEAMGCAGLRAESRDEVDA